MKQEIWDLTKLLELIKEEVRTRENCSLKNDGKSRNFDFNLEYQSSDSALFSSQNKNKPKILCVFCREPHWSDKCTVISDAQARKNFLRKGGRCFLCL